MHDAVRVGVEHAHEDVQVALVIRGLELGLERRIGIDVRRELSEGGDFRRVLPGRVVVTPIDHRRAPGAHRDGRGRCGSRFRGGGEHGGRCRVLGRHPEK